MDRGPGNAGNMGAATFGGTVKLFSEVVKTDAATRFSATASNWGTNSENINYQSGNFDLGGMTTRTLINLNYTGSSGYLTYETTARQNILIKTQTELAPGWTLTAFANYNGLWQNLNDNAGSTPAQVFSFGKNFGLQVTNPKLGTWQAYNPEAKKTDMDYLRLQGDMGQFNIDDTAYTYAYVNKTVSATNPEQTSADIAKGVTEGLGTTLNGGKIAADVPGYTKQNAYRVWGNIFRMADDFDFGWLTGELRAGVWSEWSATQRQRKDFDLTACYANGCNPWRHSASQRLLAEFAKNTSAFYKDGFYEYVEHSAGASMSPNVELELHPVEGLTVTPGFKYIDWNRSVAAPLEQKSVPVIPQFDSFTTTRSLPFLTANYKLEQSWSVYAQYCARHSHRAGTSAAFEQGTLLATPPKAETTSNYQVGTVYYADNFSFDGDLYYMGVDNNISFSPCTGNPSETCAINTGTAIYKGVEGQGTYAFGGDLTGLSFFASGSLNYSKTAGAVVKGAPLWTEADGVIYKMGDIKLSLIDKLVGQQYVGKQTLNATLTPFLQICPVAINVWISRRIGTLGAFDLGFGVYNVISTCAIFSPSLSTTRRSPAEQMCSTLPTAALAWTSISMRRRAASRSPWRRISRRF